MRDATDLAIVLKPCLGHRVGSVVGVAEPLRATLVRSGHLRCLRVEFVLLGNRAQHNQIVRVKHAVVVDGKNPFSFALLDHLFHRAGHTLPPKHAALVGLLRWLRQPARAHSLVHYRKRRSGAAYC